MASKPDDNMPSQHASLEAHFGSLGPADIPNPSAKNVSFYTPAQIPAAGTASDPQPDGAAIPKLFQPLKIRGTTLHNRVLLSPLCQYSCDLGHMTPWHMAHLGGIASRGPGMTMVEATAVQANGRITPEDSGLWLDSQIAPLAKVVEFVHSQNQVIGIQLGHAGRKASTVAPWIDGRATASAKVGGWPDDVVAPSAISWGSGMPDPRALTLDEIETLKRDFVASVQRAIKAGVDLVEIHAAHGYLYHEFLSPVSNKRTDQYGGSFENRARLLLETATLVRASIPKDMPLFVRVSGSDYLEESLPDTPSWRVEDTAKLCTLLADVGVDLVDVSGGGNHPDQHPHSGGAAYQAPMALAAKKAVGDKMLITTVGSVSDGKVAQEVLDKGLDAVFVGRGFQKNPGLVWSYAEDLGVEIMMAHQIRWGFGGRGGAQKKK